MASTLGGRLHLFGTCAERGPLCQGMAICSKQILPLTRPWEGGSAGTDVIMIPWHFGASSFPGIALPFRVISALSTIVVGSALLEYNMVDAGSDMACTSVLASEHAMCMYSLVSIVFATRDHFVFMCCIACKWACVFWFSPY